jgi:hypothetical protein
MPAACCCHITPVSALELFLSPIIKPAKPQPGQDGLTNDRLGCRCCRKTGAMQEVPKLAGCSWTTALQQQQHAQQQGVLVSYHRLMSMLADHLQITHWHILQAATVTLG